MKKYLHQCPSALEKEMSPDLAKACPAIVSTRRLIIALARAGHWSLQYLTVVHSLAFHFWNIRLHTSLPLRLSPETSPPLRFPDSEFISSTYHHFWCHYFNIWWNTNYGVPRYAIVSNAPRLLRSNYSSQDRVSNTLNILLPLEESPNFKFLIANWEIRMLPEWQQPNLSVNKILIWNSVQASVMKSQLCGSDSNSGVRK
jgi:hypothetical protein